ncbi:MAG: tRNA lysidine(34) synthetase TilS [Dehalococcoidia bacterium]|nr:MAG: tRNA lysidine(34) synthetase TilS [Dehalococcoidia bacterium]
MSDDIRLGIIRFFQNHNLTGSKLVVAVSGGPDSVCLLHLLSTLKDELGLTLHIAHLDHHLRGEESRADAEYVRGLAGSLHIPVTIGQGDVKAFQKVNKMTLEEAAREVRYLFLADVCEKIGTHYIVTGHTQNDNVETILLHIVRGSGTRGLVGLRPLTPKTIGDRGLVIVRPMLDITREETIDYCQQMRLEPRTDSSNFELSPLRNKIRLKLLPLLTDYNSNISEALLRLSSSAADELEYLDGQVAELWNKVVTRDGEVITLDREGLQNVHPALKRHLLRTCLEQLPGGLKDIESRHIEDMLSLMDKPSGRRIDLPYGLVFMAGYDTLWLGKESELPCPYPWLDGEYPLTIPGVTELPGWHVEAKVVHALDREDNSLVAYMDFDKVGQKLNVRTWKRGDRFHPLGLGAEKKLGKFMMDARIPKHWRRNIPVVVSSSGIVWLAGYRLDERVKVTSQTRRVLRLEFKRG